MTVMATWWAMQCYERSAIVCGPDSEATIQWADMEEKSF